MGAEDELKELQEHAEEARERGMIEVSLTMAVLAVIVVLFTMMGHRAHTEAGILQTKATSQWTYYDTTKGDRKIAERDLLLLGALKAEGELAEKARKLIEADVEKDTDRQAEIQTEARNLEAEAKLEGAKGTRFDYGEALLGIALVMTSITLMTRNRGFWFAGMFVAAVGTLVGASAFLLH